MKKELHIVFGTKGGVGRSTLSMLISVVTGAKTINTNTSLDEFKGYPIESVPLNNYTPKEESLLHPEATVQLIFEDIFTYFQKNNGKIVLDLSSALTIPFFYLAENIALYEICELFEEGEIGLFLHGVAGGNEWTGNERTIEKLNDSSSFKNKILWVNNFFIKSNEQNVFLPFGFKEEVGTYIVKTPLLQESTRETIQKSISNKIDFSRIKEFKELSIIKKSILNIYFEFYKKEINKIIEKAILTPREEKKDTTITIEKTEQDGVIQNGEAERIEDETLISSQVKENKKSLIFSLAKKVEKKYLDGEDEPLTREEIVYIQDHTEEAFAKVAFLIRKNKTSLQEDISNQEVRDFLGKATTASEEVQNEDEPIFYEENLEYADETTMEEE